VVGRNAFNGGWVGSSTKAQIPTVAACAWVGVAAAAVPKERMSALGGTSARHRRLERLVVIWWRQSLELPRVLALHHEIHSQARCLRLLSFPLQLLFDRRRTLMGVVVSVDPMEPTKNLSPPPRCGRCGCCGFGPLPFLCPPLCPPPFRFWFWSGAQIHC
jgi:hypothetical protein